MYIKELNTNNRYVTVTLDYDELCCINNSLYQVSKFDDVEKDKNFNMVRAKIVELFALVKHGKIPEFELQTMYKLMIEQDSATEKGGEE